MEQDLPRRHAGGRIMLKMAESEQQERDGLGSFGTDVIPLVAAAFGGAAQITDTKILRASRSEVMRLSLEHDRPGQPRTVIAKRMRPRAGRSSEAAKGADADPLRRSIVSPGERLHNEASCLKILTGLDEEPLAPRWFAGDASTSTILIEDLGSFETLFEVWIDEDRARAESLALEYYRRLGRMCAVTSGKAADFGGVRWDSAEGLGGAELAQRLRTALASVSEYLDCAPSSSCRDLLGRAALRIGESTVLGSISQGHTMPSNCAVINDRIRFFDFDFGTFRPAFLDAVQARLGFPAELCWFSVPDTVLARMERAFRESLAQAVPRVAEDHVFNRCLVDACAVKVFYHLWGRWRSLIRPASAFPVDRHLESLSECRQEGLRTLVVHGLDALATLTEERGCLQEVGQTAGILARKLAAVWQVPQRLREYPGFWREDEPNQQRARILGFFARRLIENDTFASNEEKGMRWIRRATELEDPDALEYLAGILYGDGDKLAAAELYVNGHGLGIPSATINLAYMVRRSEVPKALLPGRLEELLRPLVEGNDSFALINQALAWAKGWEGDADWLKADELIPRIPDPEAVLGWWHELANGGDSEGDLVVAWLVRHGMAEDPDGRSLFERIERVRGAGWSAPAWMLEEPDRV